MPSPVTLRTATLHTHTDATSRCKSSDGAAGHAATLCGLQDECIKYSSGHGRYRQFLKRFTSSRFSPTERASLAIASSFGLQLRFLLLALLLRFGADLLQPRLPFGGAQWGPEGAPERERNLNELQNDPIGFVMSRDPSGTCTTPGTFQRKHRRNFRHREPSLLQ